MKVLVTDGANRVALAVVRALGRAGAEVAVVEQERFALKTPAAFRSRFASKGDVLPSLGEDGEFLSALAEKAAGYDIVLPVSTNVAPPTFGNSSDEDRASSSRSQPASRRSTATMAELSTITRPPARTPGWPPVRPW